MRHGLSIVLSTVSAAALFVGGAGAQTRSSAAFSDELISRQPLTAPDIVDTNGLDILVHHNFQTVTVGEPAVQLALGIGLAGTKLQITQTEEGVTLPNGARSFITFDGVLRDAGVADQTFDVPIFQVGIGNWAALIAALSGFTMTADNLRFRINNLHADIGASDVTAWFEQDTVVVDLALSIGRPALKGEANAYLFGFIPIGWQDNACPDVSISDLAARLRIHPTVGPDERLSIAAIGVEMLGDIDASPIDHSYDQQIRDAFAGQFESALASPELRSALASGLHQLLEQTAREPIGKLTGLEITPGAFTVEYLR